MNGCHGRVFYLSLHHLGDTGAQSGAVALLMTVALVATRCLDVHFFSFCMKNARLAEGETMENKFNHTLIVLTNGCQGPQGHVVNGFLSD